jgi:hypothetical protein
MRFIESEQAKILGLVADDGGWRPEDGREIYVRVRSGAGSTAIDDVTRVVVSDAGWFIWCDAGAEVIWVNPEHILYVGSKTSEKQRGLRAGFI